MVGVDDHATEAGNRKALAGDLNVGLRKPRRGQQRGEVLDALSVRKGERSGLSELEDELYRSRTLRPR